ncbi:MAG: hypothetical protein IPH69_14945 [Bacteroidales bacterium]|nr:hypothetical protein [Bacteroidales bacterium]
MEMEELIRSKSSRFVIFRLPQVAGFSNNSNTLMNYFSNKIIKEEKFELLNVERNIIDIDDVVRIIYSFLHYDSEKYLDKVINIAYPNNIKVTSLVRLMESFYNKKAIFTMREIENYSFFVELEEFVKNCFPVSNTNDYLKSILTKYYL